MADPQAAESEWFGGFRNDLAQFLDDALIDAAVDSDRPIELQPRAKVRYYAFVDMSAGRHDASTICIMHAEGEGDRKRYIADVVRGHRAPHDPAEVAREYAALAKQYGIRELVGDNFSGEWVVGTYRDAGTEYIRAEHTRSELYLEGLPHFPRGLLNIPEQPQLLRELRQLERRVARSGKDAVNHPTGGGATDDYANALFGALSLVAERDDVLHYWRAALDKPVVLPPSLPTPEQLPEPALLSGSPILSAPDGPEMGLRHHTAASTPPAPPVPYPITRRKPLFDQASLHRSLGYGRPIKSVDEAFRR